MIVDFNSLQAGLLFNASYVAPGVNETSEQSPSSEGCDIRSIQDPTGYTPGTPNPKHHDQAAMRSSMRAEWIKSQNLEMQGLWRHGILKRFCTPPSVLKMKFSALAFNIKLRERGANLKCKV